MSSSVVPLRANGSSPAHGSKTSSDPAWRTCRECQVWWWGGPDCWVCHHPGRRQRPNSFARVLAELVGYIGASRG